MLYVCASYGFFFVFRLLFPLVSVLMSACVLIVYARAIWSALLSDYAWYHHALNQGKRPQPPFHKRRMWKRLALQVGFGLMVFAPPLVLSLTQGDVFGEVGRKYRQSHEHHTELKERRIAK